MSERDDLLLRAILAEDIGTIANIVQSAAEGHGDMASRLAAAYYEMTNREPGADDAVIRLRTPGPDQPTTANPTDAPPTPVLLGRPDDRDLQPTCRVADHNCAGTLGFIELGGDVYITCAYHRALITAWVEQSRQAAKSAHPPTELQRSRSHHPSDQDHRRLLRRWWQRRTNP